MDLDLKKCFLLTYFLPSCFLFRLGKFLLLNTDLSCAEFHFCLDTNGHIHIRMMLPVLLFKIKNVHLNVNTFNINVLKPLDLIFDQILDYIYGITGPVWQFGHSCVMDFGDVILPGCLYCNNYSKLLLPYKLTCLRPTIERELPAMLK